MLSGQRLSGSVVSGREQPTELRTLLLVFQQKNVGVRSRASGESNCFVRERTDDVIYG